MLSRVNDPSSYLIEIADLHLAAARQPMIVKENREVLRQTVLWAETFLCNPHPQLGRTGAVCPYTEFSMRENLLWLTICRGEKLSTEDVYNSVMRYRDWFLEIEPCSGKQAQFKTILIIFPDIQAEDAPKIIDVVQQELKPEFVAKGIMVGQFHPSCLESGLWNQDFHPLQAPVPLLAIRHMVLTDFPFLKSDKRFIFSYIKLFGQAIPIGVQEMIKEVNLETCREEFGQPGENKKTRLLDVCGDPSPPST